jgi:predicted DNA-binding WGR domain protein
MPYGDKISFKDVNKDNPIESYIYQRDNAIAYIELRNQRDGHYKYYKIEIFETSSSLFRVKRSWGRIGTNNSGIMSTSLSSTSVVNEFRAIIDEKLYSKLYSPYKAYFFESSQTNNSLILKNKLTSLSNVKYKPSKLVENPVKLKKDNIVVPPFNQRLGRIITS